MLLLIFIYCVCYINFSEVHTFHIIVLSTGYFLRHKFKVCDEKELTYVS